MAISSNVILSRAAFPQALASIARRAGSDESIQHLLTLASAKILAGGGEVTFLTTASGNNKSAMQECRMDAAELLTHADQALALYLAMAPANTPGAGGAVSCTYADFSGLSGCPGDFHRLF